ADSAGVDYDVLTYTVGGNRSSTTYASSYSYQPWRYTFSSSYYYDYYNYYDWYRPYYRPYYRSYYSCFFCYSPGWYVGFSYGWPSWGRSYYYNNYYAGYWRSPRYGRPYSSFAYGSNRNLTQLAFNRWNGGGSAGRPLHNVRTGVVQDPTRYTTDLADRRRREFTVTQPVAQTAVTRRDISATTRSQTEAASTVVRRGTIDGGSGTVMRRVTPEGGIGSVTQRETVSSDRSLTGRREVTTSDRVNRGGSGTIRRVDVPERRAVEGRGFSSSGRELSRSRPVNDGGDGGRSVSRDRPSYSGEGRRSPDSYNGGGRVSGGERGSPSRDGGSRPSSDRK